MEGEGRGGEGREAEVANQNHAYEGEQKQVTTGCEEWLMSEKREEA